MDNEDATMDRARVHSAALAVSGLSVEFKTRSGWVKVVDDLSFDVQPGEILGLVGESGSGKSVTCLALMRLLKAEQSRVSSHSIKVGAIETMDFGERRMRSLRGTAMSMVLQDPMSSLNPTMTIGAQVKEALPRRAEASRSRDVIVRALSEVHISSPETRVGQYPHSLSGGMRQRVCIAMAVASRPTVLFADEPTTALDVTIQQQILLLLRRLRDDHGTSIVLVTHDFGVVAQTCDKVAVMYAGRIVESGDVRQTLTHPRHPYTRALLSAVPRIGEGRGDLRALPGQPAQPTASLLGCQFAPRCSEVTAKCAEVVPTLQQLPDGTACACWRVTAPSGGESWSN